MEKEFRKRPEPITSRRVKKALGRALLFSLPTLAVSILVQGYQEFRPELEREIKYYKLTRKIKKKG